MKLAVIGAGSTYTPELVSGLMRERERIAVDRLVLHDIDPERLDVVGAMAQRMLAAPGLRRRARAVRQPRPRARRRRRDPGPDPRRRPGRAAPRRADPGRLRLRRPGDDRRRRAGEGDANRSGRARDRRSRARAGRARRVDRRLHQPGRDRHARAAGRRPPGDRPVQRRDQLPAADRGPPRRRARARARRPGRPQPPDVDPLGLGRRPRRARRRARRLRRSSWPARSGCRASCSTTWARSPPTTCATSTPSARSSRSSATSSRELQLVAEIERELLELYRDPALDTKPPLLEQRGGAFYSEAATQLLAALVSDSGDALVVDTRNGGTLAGLAEDDVVELPARIGRVAAPRPLPQRPLAPELLGLVQHVAAYERLAARGGRRRRQRTRPAGADGQPAGARVRARRRSCSGSSGATPTGARDERLGTRDIVPRHRRRQRQDRRRARRRRRAGCWRSSAAAAARRTSSASIGA